MYWILLLMGLMFSLVAAMIVGGMATPRKHTVHRVMQLEAAPEKVWAMIRTVGAYPDWRDEIRSVSTGVDAQGQLTWTEIGQKSLSYVALADEAPHRFTARITDDDLGYSGEWQYVISPSADGTRLVVTKHGEVANPFARFFSNFRGHAGTTERFMRDLALGLGERASPEPLET